MSGTYAKLIGGQEVRRGVEHVTGVRRVVIGIARPIVRLDEREPVDEQCLVDLEVLAHAEAVHDLQAEQQQWPIVTETLESDDVEAPRLILVQ